MEQVAWMRKLLFILFLGLAVYCPLFVMTHQHIVLNRYTDSWWHMSVANEYALTGEFAKDPFFSDTPKFAPFGLIDYLVAKLRLWANVDEKTGWCLVVAIGGLTLLLAGFLAGYWVNWDIVEGSISGLSTAIIYMDGSIMGVIGMGFPCWLAMALLTLLLISLFFQYGENRHSVLAGSSVFGRCWFRGYTESGICLLYTSPSPRD